MSENQLVRNRCRPGKDVCLYLFVLLSNVCNSQRHFLWKYRLKAFQCSLCMNEETWRTAACLNYIVVCLYMLASPGNTWTCLVHSFRVTLPNISIINRLLYSAHRFASCSTITCLPELFLTTDVQIWGGHVVNVYVPVKVFKKRAIHFLKEVKFIINKLIYCLSWSPHSFFLQHTHSSRSTFQHLSVLIWYSQHSKIRWSNINMHERPLPFWRWLTTASTVSSLYCFDRHLPLQQPPPPPPPLLSHPAFPPGPPSGSGCLPQSPSPPLPPLTPLGGASVNASPPGTSAWLCRSSDGSRTAAAWCATGSDVWGRRATWRPSGRGRRRTADRRCVDAGGSSGWN